MLLFLFLSRKCYDGRMKIRLDALMMARNLVSSRSQAENYIRLGKVKVRESADILHEAEARNFDEKYLEKIKKNEWKKIEKPGFFVRENAEIKLAVEEQFVSRAALKLQSVASALEVDFEGEDMGILIGKRGQTLDSLQYLTSLVVNKGKSDYIRVKLDTEDYRRRRKETLENLARGIAYKVKKTRKPVVLEPMNPYERRIIHSALQGNKFVETYSEGSEPYRHVVVAPKR